MLERKKLFIIIAILALVAGSLSAQTNSPYSRYGYGMLRDQAVGVSRGMGGIGYGLKSNLGANPLNPASYSRVDSLTFLFDIGVSGNYGKLSDGTSSSSDYNGGLDYITILIPLKKNLGFSVGLLPFSSIGYKFGGYESKENISYTKSFSGSGGLSQVYVGLGYSTPLKGLSVGANVSYLFGTLEHTRSLPAISGTNTFTSTDYSELSVKAAKFDIGLQYEKQLSKDKSLVIGAAYTPKINSKADYLNVNYVGSVGTTTEENNVSAGMPETYGLGFTYNQENKLTLGFDATFQKWDNVKYTDRLNDGLSQSDRFNDRWKYAAGAEYMINPYDRSYFKKMKFRGGVNYSNSYLNAHTEGNVEGYNEYGASFGIGLPIRDNSSPGKRTSYVNINFEYKKLSPKLSNMVSEDYFGVSLNVNINEFWFFRRKID